MARPKEYNDNLARTRLHNVHTQMMNQCYMPTAPKYEQIGKQGIGVCAEWFDFHNFYEWALDNGYEKGMSLFRNDLSMDFSPYNCVFKSKIFNKRSRQVTKLFEYNGISKPLSAWALEYGMTRDTLNKRLRRGWSMYNALTVPLRDYSGIIRHKEKDICEND